jgi:hypothetical protein
MAVAVASRSNGFLCCLRRQRKKAATHATATIPRVTPTAIPTLWPDEPDEDGGLTPPVLLEDEAPVSPVLDFVDDGGPGDDGAAD